MTIISGFQRSLQPPNPSNFSDLSALPFLQSLWAWVASGYVVIPCDAGGSANEIELTPLFRSEIGGSGFSSLLPFSFVATATSTAAVTITVSGDILPLDTLPAYVGAMAAGAGDFVAGVPYVVFYCDAAPSLSLPARMVRK